MTGNRATERPFIFVLAGVNGAGKSSLGGALLAEQGLTWFNPDTYARELMVQLGSDPSEANALAWEYGRKQLAAAMINGTNYAFETTLGARTIPAMLAEASRTHRIIVVFCGLSSLEQHIARVRLRVAHGGHDIPDEKICERWVGTRANLIKLLPHITHLQVFDNSEDATPGTEVPDPILVLEMIDGRMIFPDPADARSLASTPSWARPIVQAAIESRPGA